ncbi:hypothetical protein BdWA1_003117 [Babesia duncani]|uniref:Uncharacterized protein n=1 Tax=Babesia duncani TaxID=323732 RepID=A0AAD9PIZ7_9APIC|nr:hypothetical protein BdWA1_003117 [Babesia duncani]
MRRSEDINHDEITYTLKAHYYILNPLTPSANNLINSFFELEELKCQPPKPLWQNFTKFIWLSAFRLNRKRQRDLREALTRMDPDDVMKFTEKDIEAIAHEEFHRSMLSEALTIDEAFDEPIEYPMPMEDEQSDNVTESQQMFLSELDATPMLQEGETREEAFEETAADIDDKYDITKEMEREQ